MHWSCFPPKDHINTSRLCSVGSELPISSPTSTLIRSSPTSLAPSAVTSVPLVDDLPPWGRRLFCRYTRQPTRAPADASALEMDNRLSVRPDLPRKDKDLPGYGAILFVRAVVQHFAGLDLTSPYFSMRSSTERSTSPSRNSERSASGMIIVFKATYPRPIRSCAYASPIPLPRPSQGSLPARAGSPLAGQVSHLRDNKRNFMETSQLLQSQSTSRAWSH